MGVETKVSRTCATCFRAAAAQRNNEGKLMTNSAVESLTTARSMRLRTREAAAYVGLSYSTMTKLRLSGAGPSYIKLGSTVVYDRADLDAWLKSRKCQSTSEYGERHEKDAA